MGYKVGATYPFPPAIEDEDDPTPAAPCACGSCTRVAEAIAIARESGRFGRLTTMHACLSNAKHPWTAMASDPSDRLLGSAQGATQHEAVYELLVQLRIVT